jgi:hypothetical protein
MTRHILSILLFLAASVCPGQTAERFYGFTLNGQTINPLCL